MFQRVGSAFWGGLLVVAACGSAHADEVADLLRFVPGDANAVAVMRINELKDSPLGQARKWSEKHETEFLEGAATVPPWVTTLVRASYLRPGMPGGEWTVVLVPLPKEHDMQVLADREGTEVQDINGHPAVLAARHNGYFIEMTPGDDDNLRVLGGMMPATRQDVARWADNAAQDVVPQVSPFLTEAATDRSAQIIMAFDMENLLDPATIRYRVDGAKVLEGKKLEKAELTILFQTLQGVVFDIHVGDKMTADFHMQFGRDVGDMGPFVKLLLIDFMNDSGAALDEVYEADVSVQGRRLTLSMPLSEESLRRVLTLITTPPPPSQPTAPATEASAKPAEAGPRIDVNRSLRYWQAVNRNIDDLRRAYSRATSYARTAHWHENFADRIDNLSTNNVDADLVEYGHWVANALRGLASSLYGTAVKVNTLQNTIVYSVSEQPNYWAYGPWVHTPYGSYPIVSQPRINITSNLQDVREQQAQAVNESAPERDKIWQMIDQERSTTQQKMIERYGDKFKR